MKLQKGNVSFNRAMDDVALKGDGSLMAKNFPRLIEVEVDRLHPRADQPRRHFDEDALRQLADSIDQQGLLQPILVRAKPGARGDYEIVAGERRWRAVRLLGRTTIHAIVTTGNAEEIALVENLQRVDLSPLEEARGIQALMERHGYSQEAAAGALGWSRTQVNRVLKLLTLPESVIDECATLHISRNAMVELALASSPAELDALLEVLRRGGSVKALREARQPREGQGGRTARPRDLSSFFAALGRVEKSFDTLGKQPPVLDTDQRAQLERLRARIDLLLAGKGRG